MEFLITPQIIIDEMENDGVPVCWYKGNFKRFLNRVRFFEKRECQNNPDLQCIYILSKEDLPFCDKKLCAICIGEISSNSTHIPDTLLCLDDHTDMFSIFNMIENLLTRFRSWNKSIQQAVHSGDLQLLAQLGRTIFQNPLFVHDNHFNYIINQSWIAGQTIPTFSRRTGLGMIPVDVINELKNSKAYSQTLGTHGAHIYEDYTIDSYRVLYVNLWDGDYYKGRLCIDEMNSPILPGQLKLAEYYAEQVMEALSKRKSIINKQFTDLEKALANIIQGNSSEEDNLAECLDYLEWGINDRYVLCKIPADRLTTTDAEMLCYEIENRNPESCAFILEKDICAIFDLSFGKRTLPEITEYLIHYFLQEDIEFFFSNEFTGIQKLPLAYQQTLALAELQKLNNASQRYFYYSDYALDIIIHFGSDSYPKEMLIAPAIFQLEAYDKENGTELLWSLKQYLQYRGNLTKASEAMFIHRTTLIYRIGRIHELTGLNLDDFGQQLYLAVSLRIFEN